MTKKTLADMVWYGVGGSFDHLLEPGSAEELRDLLDSSSIKNSPKLLIGKGSNSLVSDERFPGTVVSFAGLKEIKLERDRLIVGAGVENSDLAEFAAEHSLAGIGWMNGLPGQVGGTVRMNARCYGGEISQVVDLVHCIDTDGRLVQRAGGVASFRGYKDTVFMGNGDLVVGAEFQLKSVKESSQIRQLMEHCLKDRESKHQYDYPTCGCVFKNDYRPEVSLPSGMLIEASGQKGRYHGRAQVSPFHGNFFLNKGATFREILELSLSVREEVFRHFGVWLRFEMEILGMIPADLQDRIQECRPDQFETEKLDRLRTQFANRN